MIDITEEIVIFLKFNPYIEQVPDGHYKERIVSDSPIVARYCEYKDAPMAAIEWHTEPCDIQKYRNEIKYELEL